MYLCSKYSLLKFWVFLTLSTLLIGCETELNSGPGDLVPESELLIPADLWVQQANGWIDEADSSPGYMLSGSLSGDHVELLHYFANDALYKTIAHSGDEWYTVFFEGSRLIYSEWKSDKLEKIVITAYANESPYASAEMNEGTWTPIDPSDSPADQKLIVKCVQEAKRLQSLEQSRSYHQRIREKASEIKGSISSGQVDVYYLNASMGDQIEISVSSPSQRAWFTIGGIDDVNMEYNSWKGESQESGDLVISVFSVGEIDSTNYTLSTKILSAKPETRS